MLDLIEKQTKFITTVNEPPQTSFNTENKVIMEKDNLKVRHFHHDNEVSRPILILPPQAGHASNICDYAPDQSLVRVLQEHGFPVYAADWQSASYRHRNLGIQEHINLTNDAVDLIRERTNTNSINIIGQCQGGWQAAIYTSLYQEKVKNLVVAAAPIDFKADRTFLNDYVENFPMDYFEKLVRMGGGLMNGRFILHGFKSYDPYRHYFKKYQNLWEFILEGDEDEIERWQRFYHWYEYTQDLPGKFYLEAIEKIFKENGMINPGTIVINGQPVDLKNITCPLILLAGEKDNITAPDQCFEMEKHVSTPKENITKMLTKGGHIGTLTGRRALKKYWPELSEILKKND